ncbi:MAG TPA: DMT family transporter [Ruminiclostridium sp.]|nr:DMT family transporter [Ruminiclostridium sp.]
MDVKKSRILAVAALLVTVIFWGYSFVSTKIILNELPPLSIAFFRQLIASIVLSVFLLSRKLFVKMPLKDLLLLTASSFFGIVLYFLFENTGLKYTTASNASIIVAAVPIFTLITESLFYKLKITGRITACVIVSIAGVFLVIFEQGSLDLTGNSLKGNFLMIGAMVSWVIYTVICKSLTRKYRGIVITTYQMIAASILFIPFIMHDVSKWHGITTYALINLLYLALFCSALAYYLYNVAVTNLGATVSSMFLNLIPVVSIIGGVLVLHERISVLQIAGMLLIMASLFFAGRARK